MNKVEPLITVITVVLNDRDGLERTIQSVLAQNYPNVEYIVVDGKSADGTLGVIEKYKDSISSWISEKDHGIYDAMNKGALKSTGKYLNFLNAGDSFCDDEVLEKVSKVLIEKEPGLLGCRSSIIYKDYGVTTSIGRKRMGFAKMPPHQATFVRKEIFERFGGFSLEYKSSSDLDFYSRYLKSGEQIEFADIIVGTFYSGGISSNKELSYREGYDIRKRNFGWFYGFKFYLSKILLEQGTKKLLMKLKLKVFLDKLTEINNRRRTR